jgi:sugar lactone lactonase YvrE
MNRWIRTVVLAGWWVLFTPSLAYAEKSFAEHYRDAVAAYQAGDAAAFVAAARSAREARPDSPAAAYLLSAALATAGQGSESRELLGGLADQGLHFTPGEEPAFASLELAQNAPGLLQRLQDNGQPVGEASVTLTLDEGRFVPEGLAWDAKRQRFLLGSVHQRRVVSIDADGHVTDFIAPGQDGLLSVFGMQVDARGDSLWLATSGLRESGDIPDEWRGRAGILQFDLADGELIQSHWLSPDGREHVLGDLQLLPEGGVLTTDSLTGEVLRLEPSTGRFETVVPAGRLVSPQGIALAEDGFSAWVADYRGGIFHLDLADGRLQKIAEGGTTHHGIDGLYRHGQWLIAIQNGQRPHRVVALKLQSGGLGVEGFEVLAAALQDFDDPNLGAIVDGRFHFNANSHWPQFDRDGGLPDGLSGPIVMSVPLPGAE